MASENIASLTQLTGHVQIAEINKYISQTEQSVNTLSDAVMRDFDYQAFKASKDYADQYTKQIEADAINYASHTDWVTTVYVRYNPQYSNPTSGVFAEKNSTQEDFKSVTPTDFSIYDESDVDHTGWYYKPIQAGKPLWLEPYLNKNVNTYMMTYVVPLYAENNTVIGVVGMDIDFSIFMNIVDAASIYDTGYAFITNAQGIIMHHKNLENGTKIESLDNSLANITSFLTDDSKEGEGFRYSYNGEVKRLFYFNLDNGLKLVLAAPNIEVYKDASKLINMILIALLIALVFATIVGIIVSSTIANPIRNVTKIIEQTSQLDFSPTEMGSKLRKQKDEIGSMARATHEMRNTLRDIISKLNNANLTITNDINKVDDIMKTNSERALDNSAATEELAAGVHETSNNTKQIVQNITEVKQNSEMIYHMAIDGEKNSTQAQMRAIRMEKLSGQSSQKAHEIYTQIKDKASEAVEQSKAVKRINELTEDIKKISSQTNLLALNASIEAARAGDAGKGFAVVASEIETLASQTLSSVDNINHIVVEVNNAVAQLTQCITTIMDFLENTVIGDYANFEKAGTEYRSDADKFKQIMEHTKNSMQLLEDYINQISTAADGTNEMVSQAANGINEIAEKSSQTHISTTEGYKQLQECRESAKELKQIVELFHLE